MSLIILNLYWFKIGDKYQRNLSEALDNSDISKG